MFKTAGFIVLMIALVSLIAMVFFGEPQWALGVLILCWISWLLYRLGGYRGS
jgi:hypothetical protein